MVGPDRMKSKRSVAENVRSVRRIIAIIKAHKDLNLLFANDSERLRRYYYNGYCQALEMKADSIRTYCYALKDFCNYFLRTKQTYIKLNLDDVKQTKRTVKLWRSMLSKKASKQKIQSRKKDYVMTTTPDQVKTYMESENASAAFNVANQLKTNKNYGMSQTAYCQLRDHLYKWCSSFYENERIYCCSS